jgi:hypothetical protein
VSPGVSTRLAAAKSGRWMKSRNRWRSRSLTWPLTPAIALEESSTTSVPIGGLLLVEAHRQAERRELGVRHRRSMR